MLLFLRTATVIINFLEENYMIPVTRSSMPDYDEYCEIIKSMWESRWLSNRGVIHREFEEKLKDYLNIPNVALFANGHVAMEVTIQTSGIRGEVITTPFTHVSTSHAIVRNGLTPVFCDVNEDDLTIDTEKIEALITEKTSAIVATHVYGYLCHVNEIDNIAKKYNLTVIYDAAHAFGEQIDGVGVGNFGDAAMFSTHATKVFHTIEGGIVSFKDPERFKAIDQITNFGFTGNDTIGYVGTNARMNEFEAAMGICNLRHIDDEIKKRKIAADRYVERLDNIKGIRLIKPQKGVKYNYAYFPVIFDGYSCGREEILDKLAKNEIIARRYFYPSVDLAECYHGAYSSANVPTSHYYADRVLTLPLYSELTVEEVDKICDVILEDR